MSAAASGRASAEAPRTDPTRAFTPFVGMSPTQVRALCKKSRRVFIGTIIESQPRQVLFGTHEVLHSDLTFDVERDIRNTPDGVKTLTVPGGTIDGRVVGTPSDVPLPIVGRRYVVGTTPLLAAAGPWPEGQPTLWAAVPINANVALPSVDTLKTALERQCERLHP